MKKIRLKKKSILILVLIVVLIPSFVALAKYVSEVYDYHIKKSQTFFFTSDLLDSSSTKSHLYGQGGKQITINLYNYDYKNDNDIYITEGDITYSVTTSGISGVTLSTTSGTITSNSGTVKKNNTITVTVPSSYNDLDEFTLTVKSTKPYTKTLSKTFVLHKDVQTKSYKIDDTVGSTYATLTIKTQTAISKGELTINWKATTGKGINLDPTNKYLINSDYTVPDSFYNKTTTNTIEIPAKTQIQILIFKQDVSEYYGTATESAINNNLITITKNN